MDILNTISLESNTLSSRFMYFFLVRLSEMIHRSQYTKPPLKSYNFDFRIHVVLYYICNKIISVQVIIAFLLSLVL